jgi:5-formyltetrahydrofolate cyclo-ligase
VTVSKEHLRAVMRARRGSLSLEERARRAEPIVAHLLASDAWAAARVVLAYAASRGEPSLGTLLSLAREAGKSVLLPRVDAEGLVLHRWEVGAPLVRGTYGIPEPDASWEQVRPEEVSLALVPGLAFDRKGGRLGQGGGWYDRLLPELAPLGGGARRIGVAWAFQIVPRVPCDPHDVPVDAVITEEGWVQEEG